MYSVPYYFFSYIYNANTTAKIIGKIIKVNPAKRRLHFCNTNAIKIYVFLKWKCRERGYIISKKEICRNIGLSENSKKQLQEITDITKGLQKLGLISRKTTTGISVEGEDYNRSTYYELISFDKWEEYWESDNNLNRR